MNYLYANNCRFIIRQNHNRKITYVGREILIKDLCSIIFEYFSNNFLIFFIALLIYVQEINILVKIL